MRKSIISMVALVVAFMAAPAVGEQPENDENGNGLANCISGSEHQYAVDVGLLPSGEHDGSMYCFDTAGIDENEVPDIRRLRRDALREAFLYHQMDEMVRRADEMERSAQAGFGKDWTRLDVPSTMHDLEEANAIVFGYSLRMGPTG